MIDLAGEGIQKILHHRIGDKVGVRRLGVLEPPQRDALRRAGGIACAFLHNAD